MRSLEEVNPVFSSFEIIHLKEEIKIKIERASD
jgi:hypothetical protein